MAPHLDSSRCSANKVRDDDCPEYEEIWHGFSAEKSADDRVQYGYLQVDCYRSYKKRSGEPKIKRWVPLPIGTQVQGVSCSRRDCLVSQAGRSCLRQSDGSDCGSPCSRSTRYSAWSDATVASSSDRRVHFRDELLGCDETDLDTTVAQAPLAEWTFIDRDTCGFSLHEYAPHLDDVKDFASSLYACQFLEELDDVEILNACQQSMVASSQVGEECRREERQLDKALLLAGVRADCIHAAPEDIHQACLIEVTV